MANMTFEVEVYCTCGNELTVKESGDGTLEAQPCQSCLDEEYDKGYREGESAGED